jgi:hypothetical protein
MCRSVKAKKAKQTDADFLQSNLPRATRNPRPNVSFVTSGQNFPQLARHQIGEQKYAVVQTIRQT